MEGTDVPTNPAEEFAATLIAARRDGKRAPASAAEAFAATADVADATRVQSIVADACGPVAAWKTAPGADAPMIAPILARGVRPSPATYGTDEIGACGIELEIAFRIDRPLPSPDAPDFAEALKASVTALAAIEVVDGRFDGFADGPPMAKLADNQLNGGLVLGGAGTLASSSPAVRLTFDGRVVKEGPAAPPGGDAYKALETFVRHVGSHCGGLAVGQVVTTGSLSGMLFVEPGTRVEGSVEGLGEVSVTYRPG